MNRRSTTQAVIIVALVTGGLAAVWMMSAKRPSRGNSAHTGLHVESSSELATSQCPKGCPNRVLVKFINPLSKDGQKNIQSYLEERLENPVVVKKLGALNVVSISADGLDINSFSQKTKLESFASQFGIEYIEPDAVVKLDSLPKDEFFKNQWGLHNEGQVPGLCATQSPTYSSKGLPGADINIDDAWGKTLGMGEIVVAVLDTGIRADHPDFIGNIWSAPKDFDLEIGGEPVHCAAGSHGFNAINNTCVVKDTHGHGTNVAGILGAVSDDRVGTVGVSQKISIMAIKVFEGEDACVSQIANAIEFLTKVKRRDDLKADIRLVNNSYGFKGETTANCKLHENCKSKTLKEAVGLTLEDKMLFVASAGNDTQNTDCVPHFPSGYGLPNILSIAASTNLDELASFSNFGLTSVHLVAPGLDICAPGLKGYEYVEGTSMAAPFASGSAALVLSRCGLRLSYLDVKNKLLDNSDAIDFSFKGKTLPGRRLNVGKAVLTCGP